MKRKRAGHYCWVCGRQRPNERFSGGGDARHVCRDCAKLGAEELAFRQGARDIERTLGVSGFVRRRHRARFESFLQHPNPRVRQYARDILAANQLRREAEALEADAEGPPIFDEEDNPFSEEPRYPEPQ